jgi:hypothetical protein
MVVRVLCVRVCVPCVCACVRAVLVNFFIFIFMFLFLFLFLFLFDIPVSFSIHPFIHPNQVHDSLVGLVVVVDRVVVRVESGLLEVELLSLQSSLSHHCFAYRKEPECSDSPSFVPLGCGPLDCFHAHVRAHCSRGS